MTRPGTWNAARSATPTLNSSRPICAAPDSPTSRLRRSGSRRTSELSQHGIQHGARFAPLRAEIERRDSGALERALDAVTGALASLDGSEATISAHFVTAVNDG